MNELNPVELLAALRRAQEGKHAPFRAAIDIAELERRRNTRCFQIIPLPFQNSSLPQPEIIAALPLHRRSDQLVSLFSHKLFFWHFSVSRHHEEATGPTRNASEDGQGGQWERLPDRGWPLYRRCSSHRRRREWWVFETFDISSALLVWSMIIICQNLSRKTTSYREKPKTEFLLLFDFFYSIKTVQPSVIHSSLFRFLVSVAYPFPALFQLSLFTDST